MKSRAEEELEEWEDVFSALAHPTRRLILITLMARKGSMTAGEIVERFSYRWPTVTRHLKQLEAAGLVQVSKQGRERKYVLDRTRLMRVVLGWLQWFHKKEEV